jgi:hypothetical protein
MILIANLFLLLQSAVVQLEVVRWIEHQISYVKFVRRKDKLGLLL